MNFEIKSVPVEAIAGVTDSYTGDGNTSMDKAVKGYYIKDNQELIVESVFIGEKSVKDVIKVQLKDRVCNKIEMATPSAECYNDAGNTVVVASEEVIQ